MSYFDWNAVIRNKRSQLAESAQLPIESKMRVLERLLERKAALSPAGFEPSHLTSSPSSSVSTIFLNADLDALRYQRWHDSPARNIVGGIASRFLVPLWTDSWNNTTLEALRLTEDHEATE